MSKTRDEVIEEMYRGGRTQKQIASVFRISRQRVSQILIDRDVPTRPRSKGRVKEGRRWKIRAPQHPHATEGYVFEHVLAYEARTGRYVDPATHVVVALDGDYENTDLSNLMVVRRYSETHKDLVYRPKHPSGLMLLALRWAAMQVGHTPSQKEVLELTGYYPTAFHDRFGSRRKADVAVGLLSNLRGARALQPLPADFTLRNQALREYSSWEAVSAAWQEKKVA